MTTFSRAVICALGATAAITIGAAPASAADVAQVTSASLLARGAGVSVAATVECDPYTNYNGLPSTAVDVTLAFRQSVKKGNLTTGSVDTGFLNICDGTPHALNLVVYPSPYAAIKGSALFTVTETFDSFGGPPFPQTFTDVVDVR